MDHKLKWEMETELTKLNIALNKSKLDIITLQEKVRRLEEETAEFKKMIETEEENKLRLNRELFGKLEEGAE